MLEKFKSALEIIYSLSKSDTSALWLSFNYRTFRSYEAQLAGAVERKVLGQH